MKAMVLTAPGELARQDVARPGSASGDVLVHVPRLTASFDALVPQMVDGDEAADLLPDYPPYRDALRAALRAVDIPVGR